MFLSAPQYLLEFSILLGVFYVVLQSLQLRPADRNSLMAGVPIICLILPALRISGLWEDPQTLGWLNSGISIFDADWSLVLRNARVGDLFFLAYWMGFAVMFARLVDRLYFASREFYTGTDSIRRAPGQKWLPENRAFAGLLLIGTKVDNLLLERTRHSLPGRIRWTNFLEGMMLEIMVLIFWWNPLIHLFRKEYLRGARAELVELYHPSRATHLLVDQVKDGLYFLVFGCITAILLFNFQANHSSGQSYVKFFEGIDLAFQTPIWGQEQELDEEVSLWWGGHEIPLAEVRSDDELAYEVYHLTPFEFHLLRREVLRVKNRSGYSSIHQMIGRIGVPNSNQLSTIRTEKDFLQRLPRLVSMGEQTLYLRLEDEEGRTWVAVLAISETQQIYNLQKGVQQIAGEVAAIELVDQSGKKVSSPYRFSWGKLEVPLEKYASPDVYRGFLEVSLDSLQSILHGEMQFFAQDSLLSIEHLTVRAYGSPNWRSVIWYPDVELDQATLADEHLQDDLFAALAPGHEIVIYGKAGALHVNTIAIRVHDPNQLYRPGFRAPEISQEAPEYTFQLVNRPGYPSVIRVDTLDEVNDRIMDIYRGREEYEINHVEGFRTNERLVNVPQIILDYLDSQSWIDINDLGYGLDYPEWYDYQEQIVQLNWGEMWAMPNSGVYDPDEYELNRREGLQLSIGGQVYAIEKARASFVHDGRIKGIYFMEPNDWDRPHLLPKAAPETTIFFEDMIISDSTGKQFILPISFAFHIGKENGSGDWIIAIKDDYAKEPLLIESEGTYEYRHYRLSELISELISVKSNRLEIENMKVDPFVRVYFHGEQFRKQQAQEIILRSLQKKYGFIIKSHRVKADVRRMQVNFEDRLMDFRYEGEEVPPEDKVQSFEMEGYQILRGVTLKELAEILEDRFGVVFEWYPTPYSNTPFNFNLVLDTLPSVEQQLLDGYGIQLFAGDWLFNGVLIQFGNN